MSSVPKPRRLGKASLRDRVTFTTLLYGRIAILPSFLGLSSPSYVEAAFIDGVDYEAVAGETANDEIHLSPRLPPVVDPVGHIPDLRDLMEHEAGKQRLHDLRELGRRYDRPKNTGRR